MKPTARSTAFIRSVGLLLVILILQACGKDQSARADRTSGNKWGRSVWIGTWNNADAETAGITKFVIGVEDAAYMIEVWGECRPDDCYWGKVAGEIPNLATDYIRTTWVTTFAIKQLNFRLQADGTVELKSRIRFTDQSSRSDFEITEQFSK